METMYQVLLAMHIIGFIAAIGTLISSLASYNQFWKLYAINKDQGKAAFNALLKTRVVGMVGLLIAILAGLGMEMIVAGAHSRLLWFKIKMPLIVIILVNSILFGRIITKKLKRFLATHEETTASVKEAASLKRSTAIFQYSQLLIFLVVVIMVAFRFN